MHDPVSEASLTLLFLSYIYEVKSYIFINQVAKFKACYLLVELFIVFTLASSSILVLVFWLT